MATAAAAPHFCLDEKWKLSKKEGSRSRSSTSAISPLMRSRSSSASSISPLMRSRSSSTSSISPLMRNSSERRCSFSRKCASLVKEQRARFYIMRRCVTMLVCWREYGDS